MGKYITVLEGVGGGSVFLEQGHGKRGSRGRLPSLGRILIFHANLGACLVQKLQSPIRWIVTKQQRSYTIAERERGLSKPTRITESSIQLTAYTLPHYTLPHTPYQISDPIPNANLIPVQFTQLPLQTHTHPAT